MKTNKGLAITFLGDGGICIRADWYLNGRNILISGRDYKGQLLFNVIENLRDIKQGLKIDNIYER